MKNFPVAAVGVIVIALLGGCSRDNTSGVDKQPASNTTPERDEFDQRLVDQNSSRTHFDMLARMAETMISLKYDDGTPGSVLKSESLPSILVGVFLHPHQPKRLPYLMWWNLCAWGSEIANDIPVSYLMIDSEARLDRKMAKAAAGEFGLIASWSLVGEQLEPVEDSPFYNSAAVGDAIDEAYARLEVVRSQAFDGISFRATSGLHEVGNYRVMVEMSDFPKVEGRASDSSRIVVNFLYARPDLDVDFTKVGGNGFSYRP